MKTVSLYEETNFKEILIGRIPKDWEIVPIVKVCEGTTNHFLDGDWILMKYIVGKGDVRLVQLGNIGTGTFIDNSYKWIIYESFLKLKCKLIQPDDILVSRMAEPIARSCILPNLPYPCITAVDISIVRVNKSRFDIRFVNYAFNSSLVLKQAEAMSAGATRKRISRKNLEKIKIPRPPLPEQRKIAEILSTIDEAIQRVDEAIARTQRLKRGLMQELLTEGIGHEEFKGTEIGKVPKEWTAANVRNFLELLTDFEANGSFSDLRNNVKVYDNCNYAWYVRAIDLEKKQYPFQSGLKYTDKGSYEFLRKTKLKGGELLMTKRGEIGKVYLMPKINYPATLGPNLYLFKLKNSLILNEYLYYYLISPYGLKELRRLKALTTLGALYKEDVKNLKVPLPSVSEQQRIVEYLLTIDKKLELERKRKEKLARIKQGLMNDLLTGRKRVKVAV